MNGQKSVIEDYYNNLSTISDDIQPSGDEADLHRHIAAELSTELREALNTEQYELHEKYMKAICDTTEDTVYKAYREGLYLGLRLMSESFYCKE